MAPPDGTRTADLQCSYRPKPRPMSQTVKAHLVFVNVFGAVARYSGAALCL